MRGCWVNGLAGLVGRVASVPRHKMATHHGDYKTNMAGRVTIKVRRGSVVYLGSKRLAVNRQSFI